jgi:XTP/dITP diphosphohydrolase
MKLVLATTNNDKIREMRKVLNGLPLEILTYHDFDDFPNAIEDQSTIAGNAEKKAKAIWNEFQIPALADDTGLFVDALDGAPGVYSSRFAGKNASYKDNRRKLLKLLKDTPFEKRTAEFRTVIALVIQSDKVITVEGRCKGYIAFEERGEEGFGYDPIFIYDSTQKTFAEMPLEEKNKISHRGIALQKIKNVLQELLANNQKS